MKRFRGTDVGLGVLAIAVNVALVVALVVWVSGRNDEPPLPSASTPTPTASASRSASPSPTASPSGPSAIMARTTPVTLAVLGDQTSDGQGEWVSVMAELLGRDREVTLHQLDPQDPTLYKGRQTFGSSGPAVAIYNGSRAGATGDYAAKRLAFLSPRKPDVVVLNYGRNDSAENVEARLASTTTAARKAWKGVLVVATLQPPTTDDGSKEVRAKVEAWAAKSRVPTLDVAAVFLGTGEPDAYVSPRDSLVMTGRGDRLWGQTAYRLLVGSEPPALPEVSAPTPTAVETTEPAVQPSTPRRTPRPRPTAPPESTAGPTQTPQPSQTGPIPTVTGSPRPTFTFPPEPDADSATPGA